jgi:6-phosphogluconate dehydrogenase
VLATSAIGESVPAPVHSAALYERFSSRGEGDFACKVVFVLRFQFGGHEEKGAADEKVSRWLPLVLMHWCSSV